MRLLGIIFILVYLEGLFVRIGIPAGIYKIILEGSIVVFTLINIKYLLRANRLIFIPLLLLLLAIISCIINNQSIIFAFNYLRYIIYIYIIFQVIKNKYVSESQINYLNKTLIILFILQIVGSIFQIFIIGERVEGYVGLMSYTNGTTATIFPLVAVAICIGLYFFYNNKLSYLFLLIGFLIISYSSGKRAIYFYFPMLLFISISVRYLFFRKSMPPKINHLHVLIFIPITCLAIFWGITNSKGIGGTEDSLTPFKKVKYAFSYAQDGNRLIFEEGSAGRSSTNKRLVNYALSNKKKLFFGEGPMSIREASQPATLERLNVVYGITGFGRDIISIGLIGAIVSFVFFYLIFISLKSISLNDLSPKYKSIYFAVILIFIIYCFTHFNYSADFSTSGKVAFITAYLVGLILNPGIDTKSESIYE